MAARGTRKQDAIDADGGLWAQVQQRLRLTRSWLGEALAPPHRFEHSDSFKVNLLLHVNPRINFALRSLGPGSSRNAKASGIVGQTKVVELEGRRKGV